MVHTEKYYLQRLHESAEVLEKKFNIPIGLVYYRKNKNRIHGSRNIKDKLKDAFRTDASYNQAMADDTVLLSENNADYDPTQARGAYAAARGSEDLSYLDYPLQYMNHLELQKWLVNAIMKDYHSRGGTRQQITLGMPEMEATWWPSNIWPWHTVRSLRKKEGFPGPGGLVPFLKDCVRLCLQDAGKNEAEWVNPLHNPRTLAARRRARGHAAAAPPSDSSSSGSNNSSVVDPPENAGQNPPDNINDAAADGLQPQPRPASPDVNDDGDGEDDGQQPPHNPASPDVNDDVLDISTPNDSQLSVLSVSEASTPSQRQSPRQSPDTSLRRSPSPDDLPDIEQRSPTPPQIDFGRRLTPEQISANRRAPRLPPGPPPMTRAASRRQGGLR